MEDSTENIMPPMEDGTVEEENINASQEASAMAEDVVNEEVNAPTVEEAAAAEEEEEEEEVVEEKEEEAERPPPRLMISITMSCLLLMHRPLWSY